MGAQVAGPKRSRLYAILMTTTVLSPRHNLAAIVASNAGISGVG
jgi:hypothetical protein